MLLTSPSFNSGEAVPRKFTCEGGDINPELQIQNVPSEAKSLALILHDPDAPDPAAPRPTGFTHWVVWNIDPATTLIKQESIPLGGTEGKNSGDRNGYMGPCPRVGEHRYYFQLYALDTKMDIPAASGKQELEKAMEGHIIEQTELVGLYRKD